MHHIMFKAKLKSISSDTRQLHAIPLHHFTIKEGLYRIQILCRRHPFWSYPAELTQAEVLYTTIAETMHTTPNVI